MCEEWEAFLLYASVSPSVKWSLKYLLALTHLWFRTVLKVMAGHCCSFLAIKPYVKAVRFLWFFSCEGNLGSRKPQSTPHKIGGQWRPWVEWMQSQVPAWVLGRSWWEWMSQSHEDVVMRKYTLSLRSKRELKTAVLRRASRPQESCFKRWGLDNLEKQDKKRF